MSSLMNPVGPEEPSTYWRRRAIVGVGLLAVLVLVWWLFSAVFGSDDEPTAPTSPGTPAASATPTPTASAAGVAQAGSDPAPPACRDAEIVVAVKPDSASAPVGSGLRLTMSVTNAGSQACTRGVGPRANEVRIVSGSVLVWSSDYCSDSKGAASTLLEPDQPWTQTVTWPGKVTAADCPADQPTAQAGAYRAVATNGTVASSEAAFQVG